MLNQHEQIIVSRRNVLGLHPYTLRSMLCLAWSLFYLSRYDECVRLFEEVVVVKSHQLGPEHCETLPAQQGLAWTYIHVKGGRRKSVELFDTIPQTQEKLSDTMSAVHGLAVLASGPRNYARAMELAQNAVEVQMRLLGREHSDY
jgi:hypothetical protein